MTSYAASGMAGSRYGSAAYETACPPTPPSAPASYMAGGGWNSMGVSEPMNNMASQGYASQTQRPSAPMGGTMYLNSGQPSQANQSGGAFGQTYMAGVAGAATAMSGSAGAYSPPPGPNFTMEEVRSHVPPELGSTYQKVWTEHLDDVQLEAEYYERTVHVPKYEIENRERLVEVPQPQIVDRIIEIPQIQEVIHELPGEKEIKLITREVPKIEVQQREVIVEVPQIEYQDRYVEVPEIREIVRRIPRVEVREIPIERVIQVPKKMHQEVEQPIYRPVPHLVQQPVEREIPIPRTQLQTMEVVTQNPVAVGVGESPTPPLPAQGAATTYGVSAGGCASQISEPMQASLSCQASYPAASNFASVAQSGRIVQPASVAAVQPTFPATSAQVSSNLFDALDRNHDGVLTREELQSAGVVAQSGVVQSAVYSAASPPTPPTSYVPATSTVAQQRSSYAQPSVLQSSTVLQSSSPAVVYESSNLQSAARCSGYMTPPTPPAGSSPMLAAGRTLQSGIVSSARLDTSSVRPLAASRVQGSQVLGTQIFRQSGDAFSALDHNHDGVLTRDEFVRSGMSPADISFSSRNMSASYAGRAGALSSMAIPSTSIGASNYIQSQSYSSGGGARMAQTMGQLDMFGAMDRNGDGSISREEFNQAARSGLLGPIAVA